jgi:hypothetical protein
MMLLLTETVVLTEPTVMHGIQPKRAITTLALLQGSSVLSISMLLSMGKMPQLITLPIRYELTPKQINELHMSFLISELRAREASGVGSSIGVQTLTSNTFISASQKLAMKIVRFFKSHF